LKLQQRVAAARLAAANKAADIDGTLLQILHIITAILQINISSAARLSAVPVFILPVFVKPAAAVTTVIAARRICITARARTQCALVLHRKR